VADTTCLVTIHGIGFQQAPERDEHIPGYADALHLSLSRFLEAELLSDDPHRERTTRGEAGPIYVQSHWPPESRSTEAGLARLGTWTADGEVDHKSPAAQLTDGIGKIAHIGLVYSHLEDQGSQVGASIEAVARAAVGAGHYATVAGLVNMLFRDLLALHSAPPAQDVQEPLSLSVRREVTGQHHPTSHLLALARIGHASERAADPSSLVAVLRTLENDVAAYVAKNELRERVKAFIREALLRLGFRDDVGAIVINSHSQGTVAVFDVFRDLPLPVTDKIRWFVTAGSPLRKYVDLFSWGVEAADLRRLTEWTNFWDERDPVADPLDPPASWLRGDPIELNPRPDVALFQVTNPITGVAAPRHARDLPVNNVANSPPGGLRAHNYWDNQVDVVKPLAAILRKIVVGTPQ
jgi:hypothetical protein